MDRHEKKNCDEESLLAFIKERKGGVSFAEIMRDFDVEGEYCLERTGKNLIYWAGLSESFVKMFVKLMQEKKIYIQTTKFLVYLIDGQTLTFPIARRWVNRTYKKPHWLPVTIELGQPKSKKNVLNA